MGVKLRWLYHPAFNCWCAFYWYFARLHHWHWYDSTLAWQFHGQWSAPWCWIIQTYPYRNQCIITTTLWHGFWLPGGRLETNHRPCVTKCEQCAKYVGYILKIISMVHNRNQLKWAIWWYLRTIWFHVISCGTILSVKYRKFPQFLSIVVPYHIPIDYDNWKSSAF